MLHYREIAYEDVIEGEWPNCLGCGFPFGVGQSVLQGEYGMYCGSGCARFVGEPGAFASLEECRQYVASETPADRHAA
jgi:hypothetical protein